MKYNHRRENAEGIWERRCSHCLNWFLEDREHFYRQKHWWNSWCRECDRVRARDTMSRRRADTGEAEKVRRAKEKHRKSLKGKDWRRQRFAVDNAIRETRLRNAPYALTVQQWNEIKTLLDYKCAYCDTFCEKLELEHVVPLCVDNCPGTVIGNVVPACPDCNRSKGVRRVENWRPDIVPHLRVILDLIERSVSDYSTSERSTYIRLRRPGRYDHQGRTYHTSGNAAHAAT